MKSLQRWMDRKGVTQQVLADRVGYAQSTVSSVLSGVRRPSLVLLRLLAATSGIPAGKLMADYTRQNEPSVARVKQLRARS